MVPKRGHEPGKVFLGSKPKLKAQQEWNVPTGGASIPHNWMQSAIPFIVEANHFLPSGSYRPANIYGLFEALPGVTKSAVRTFQQ